MKLDSYLSRLASADAAPGGGAAAALTAAQGAALLAMGLRLSEEPSPHLDPQARLEWLARLDELRERFYELMAEDGKVFEDVLAAYKRPKTSAEEKARRTDAIQDALKAAAAVPLEVMSLAHELLEAAEPLVLATKPQVVSDAGIAAILLGAALKASRFNVTVNLKHIKDEDFVRETSERVDELVGAEKSLRKALVKAARHKL